MSEESNVVARGVLTIITDKLRARSLLQSSLEGLGYRVVPFDDVRSAAAYVEADIHLLDSGAASDLSADLHRLEESAPVLLLMPPGSIVTPAFRQASAGFIGMAARVEEYALRLEIAAASSGGSGYRVAAPRNGSPAPGPKVALVADADDDCRHLAIFKLRALGFEPLEAASGSEALELATHTSLALAIVADDVPPDGGLALLQRLRAAQPRPGPAALVTTVAPTPLTSARAEADGAAVLVKPFRVNELAECVDRVTPARSGASTTSIPKEMA